MKEVVGCLTKIITVSNGKEQCFSWGKGYFEHISFVHGVRKVAPVALIVFGGESNVPSNTFMGAKRGARFGRSVCNNASAWRCQESAVVIKVAKNGCMSGERWVYVGRTKKVESEYSLWK